MKTISTLALLLFSFITLGQTTKTKKDVKIEEVPHKNIELINADGTYNSISDAPQMPEESITDNKIYSIESIEAKPEFPGGKDKMILYLDKAFVYSQEMKNKKLKGEAYATLIIEIDGSITDIKINRDLGFGTDKEVLRILKSMPKWNSGMYNGRNVRCLFPLVINIDATKQ